MCGSVHKRDVSNSSSDGVDVKRAVMNSSLFFHTHVPERSSPSRVRFAAQKRRALDRSGPFRRFHLEKGKGANANSTFTRSLLRTLPIVVRGWSTKHHRRTTCSCQVCWRATEMAQRWIRRFLNLMSVEVLRDRIANREENGRNPSWPGVADSTKGRIHLAQTKPSFSVFACNSA